jgi:hypothetical protein
LAAAVALGWPLPSAAQPTETADRAAARELGEQGIAAYRAGRFEEALDRLSRAHALVQLSTTGLWRARCLVQLGRLVEAAEQYLEVSRMQVASGAPELHRKAVGEAEAERAALLPRIPHLRLVSAEPLPAAARVLLDGRELSTALLGVEQPVDPGAHLVRIEHDGGSWEKPFELGEGGSLELPLELPAREPTPPPSAAPPPPSAAPSPARPAEGEPSSGGAQGVLGWIAVGLGGAGLVLGGVSGGLALDRKSTLDEGCPGGNCPPPLHGDVDAFETLRLVSTVGFVAGGALFAGGVVLLLTAPPAKDEGPPAAARLRFGVEGAWLEGSF